MANEITLVNGVTKIELQGSGNYRYLFPLAQIVAYPNADPNEGYYNLFIEGNNVLRVKFSDIADKLGSTNIVEYVDALATNQYFFGVDLTGSIGVNDITNRVVVNNASQLVNIDPSKEYFLNGFINITGTGIDLTDTSLTIRSLGFNLGGLINNDVAGNIFSGTDTKDLIASKMAIICPNGEAFDLVGKKETSAITSQLETQYAIEIDTVNFNNCASLGTLTDYRQYLEIGCAFFGGNPTVTLDNTLRLAPDPNAGQPLSWNGWRSTTNLSRSSGVGLIKYKAGTNFRMTGSFLCDINIDLNGTGVLSDFSPTNFTTVLGVQIPNVLQFSNVRVFRNGVINTDYLSALPNTSEKQLTSDFGKNRGLGTTKKGGRLEVTAEAVTTINTQDVYENIAGTTTLANAVHTDSPANFQLRNIDKEPNDFNIAGFFVVEGNAGDSIAIGVFTYDDGGINETLINQFQATVDNVVVIADSAKIYIDTEVTLNPNGYVGLKIKNQSGSDNVTVTTDSFFRLKP